MDIRFEKSKKQNSMVEIKLKLFLVSGERIKYVESIFTANDLGSGRFGCTAEPENNPRAMARIPGWDLRLWACSMIFIQWLGSMQDVAKPVGITGKFLFASV